MLTIRVEAYIYYCITSFNQISAFAFIYFMMFENWLCLLKLKGYLSVTKNFYLDVFNCIDFNTKGFGTISEKPQRPLLHSHIIFNTIESSNLCRKHQRSYNKYFSFYVLRCRDAVEYINTHYPLNHPPDRRRKF